MVSFPRNLCASGQDCQGPVVKLCGDAKGAPTLPMQAVHVIVSLDWQLVWIKKHTSGWVYSDISRDDLILQAQV